MKITILALTLNEIDGVKVILPQIDPLWYDQLLILDGGSNDGTLEWCKKNNYETLIQKKKGLWNAYTESLDKITGDIVLTLSPDGNCDPKMIPKILEEIKKGYELVIGSRYLGGKKSEDDDYITAFGNWLFNKTVRFLYNGNLTDVMVIYRAFNKSLIYDLDLHKKESHTLPEKLFFTNISWEPLMSVRALKAKKSISEVYAGEPPRIGGERKLQLIRWGAAYYFQFWRELWYWKKNK